MSININPVDFRGFSVGNGGVPQLPNIGGLGLQALQLVQNQQQAAQDAAIKQAQIRSADEAMLRQNMLERAKMNQQASQFNRSYGLDARKMGLLENQAASDQLLKQQQLGSETDINNRKLDLGAAELKFNEWKGQQIA